MSIDKQFKLLFFSSCCMLVFAHILYTVTDNMYKSYHDMTIDSLLRDP